MSEYPNYIECEIYLNIGTIKMNNFMIEASLFRSNCNDTRPTHYKMPDSYNNKSLKRKYRA